MMEQWWLVASIGLFAGVVSGLLGIGGGLIIVPLLMFIGKIDIHHAVGTSLAIIIPTAAFATLRHHVAGHVDWRFVVPIAFFTVIGGLVGAQMSAMITASILRKIFAVFLVAVAVRMIFQS